MHSALGADQSGRTGLISLCPTHQGRITSDKDLNLVICKSTLVEIYLVNSEGLKFIKQFQIWGVVENLNTVKAKVRLLTKLTKLTTRSGFHSVRCVHSRVTKRT